MGNYHGLTLSLLVRCMALPSLKFLTLHITDGIKLREDAIQRVLPNLCGTSSVEHLRLQQVILVTDDFLAPLFRIPRRLRTYGLTRFRSHDPVYLRFISGALQHVQQSLEVLEIYHAEPALVFRDLLPPSLIFWNIRMDAHFLSDLTKRRPLFMEGAHTPSGIRKARDPSGSSNKHSSKHIWSYHHDFTDGITASRHSLVVVVKSALILFLRPQQSLATAFTRQAS
jgi:hypothetical protein